MQDYDCQMVDDVNDVRIIGLVTALIILLVALAGMSWEARVSIAEIKFISI